MTVFSEGLLTYLLWSFFQVYEQVQVFQFWWTPILKFFLSSFFHKHFISLIRIYTLPQSNIELFVFVLRGLTTNIFLKRHALHRKWFLYEMQYWAETSNLADIYLLKVNNRSTTTSYEICSKLTIVNFENISHFILVFLCNCNCRV